MERTVYSAYRSRACAGLGNDIAVNLALTEHFCNDDTLRESLDFGNGAKVLKEIVAFIDRLELQYRFKQIINAFVLQFIAQNESSFPQFSVVIALLRFTIVAHKRRKVNLKFSFAVVRQISVVIPNVLCYT